MSTVHFRFAGVAVAAALAVAALVLPISVPAAHAGAADGTSSNPARIGLYGQQTPKYDGVYRQSLTLIALQQSGAVDQAAIRWLRRQQCGNGSWMSFRSDLGQPCGLPDSNATAMAVIALKSLGSKTYATRGLDWLVNRQLDGGGWEYTTGWGADSNSTGLAVQALIAMKVDPETVTNNGSPYDFLESLQLGCDTSGVNVRGSLDYQVQPDLQRNDYATSQATQALAGSTLPVAPAQGVNGFPTLECGTKVAIPANTPAEAAAGYLGRRLKANNGSIPSAFGPGTDYGSTANAVLSLVAAGYGANQVSEAMARLERSVRKYVLDPEGKILPAGGSLMVLAETATGGQPRNVDGLNLVRKLQRSITERAGTR